MNKSRGNIAPMRIERFAQLAKTDIKLDWIVEGLLSPGGWTYFVGPPGSGKSIMTIQLCDALQLGKPFLNMPTKQHNCLYIQADAGLLEWKEQIRKIAGDSFAWTVHDVPKGFIDDARWVTYLHDIVWGTYPESDNPKSPHAILKHIPYTFVVFDCLNAITQKDLNMKTAMSQVLAGLEAITTRTLTDDDTEQSTKEQVHYLLIHHPNKSVTRGVNAGSGYGGFAGLCCNMLTLANNILVLEKTKIASKKEIVLERNEDTGAWILPSTALEKGEDISYEDLLKSILVEED